MREEQKLLSRLEQVEGLVLNHPARQAQVGYRRRQPSLSAPAPAPASAAPAPDTPKDGFAGLFNYQALTDDDDDD